MALPALVQHTGALAASPSTGSVGVPSLQELMNTTFSATYSARKSGSPSIINATDLAPFVIDFETITKCRVFAMQVRSGNLDVKLTSANGVDQEFSCGTNGLVLLHLPFAGNELTAIKLVGTADIEYVLAGDVS